MIPFRSVPLGELLADISAGVSFQGESRLPTADEVGILTLSAVSGIRLDPDACKAIAAELIPKLGPEVQGDTILMARSNTPELVGSCVYVEKDIPKRFLPDLIWELRLRQDAPCSGRWLAEYLRSAPGKRNLLRAAAGTSGSMLKLSMERLRRLSISLPPLDVQQAIVKYGGYHDRFSEGLQSLTKAKRTMKRGLVQHLLTGAARFPEFADSKWDTVALKELLTHVPRVVTKPAGTFLSAGIRSHGRGVFLKREFPAEGIALEELYRLKEGDLVVNITFGWEGAVAIVPREADGALVSHRFPTYQIDSGIVSPGFLQHVIRTRRFVFDVARASPGGAGRNRVLNRRKFLEITVNLPSIAEQERLSSLLNSADQEIDLLERLREYNELQKRALLRRLSSGETPLSV